MINCNKCKQSFDPGCCQIYHGNNGRYILCPNCKTKYIEQRFAKGLKRDDSGKLVRVNSKTKMTKKERRKQRAILKEMSFHEAIKTQGRKVK